MPESLPNSVFLPAPSCQGEVEKLDNLHHALTEYLGGRISFAPLENENPKQILDMGSGTGAWAIQAALQLPEAQVVAADMKPMPIRDNTPTNLRYSLLDPTDPCPFEGTTFDVVHARFVIMHVPLPYRERVLQRASELVKPGGWLLVEDPDDDTVADGDGPPGPAMSALVPTWSKTLRSSGAEPSIGRDLAPMLRALGLFSEVNVRKIVIPLSEKSADPAENQLGHAWKINYLENMRDLPSRLADQGITPELARRVVEELEDPTRALKTEMYFTWSRRKMN